MKKYQIRRFLNELVRRKIFIEITDNQHFLIVDPDYCLFVFVTDESCLEIIRCRLISFYWGFCLLQDVEGGLICLSYKKIQCVIYDKKPPNIELELEGGQPFFT